MSKFSIDKNRTKPRKVKRGGNTTIEAILSFSTKNGIGESVVRLTEEKENNGIYKCWSIMTSLSSMGKSEDSNINKVEKIKNFKAPNWLDIRNFEKTYENKQPDVLVVGAGRGLLPFYLGDTSVSNNNGIFKNVVFPDPFGPIRPIRIPGLIDTFTLLNRSPSGKDLDNFSRRIIYLEL